MMKKDFSRKRNSRSSIRLASEQIIGVGNNYEQQVEKIKLPSMVNRHETMFINSEPKTNNYPGYNAIAKNTEDLTQKSTENKTASSIMHCNGEFIMEEELEFKLKKS